MALRFTTVIPLLFIAILLLATPTHAFGAGNIASIARVEGVNWRHGDIEDTLLTIVAGRLFNGKKFSKLDVKRVYFGNWLRDYSQAVDVGTVKYVSADAIRLLLWVLGFMSFGYGTGEFEVTKERLGCYRPEEHIDNPKDYADNVDARQYDRRLRGPVNERVELAIDQRTGLKTYIASEDAGITTSAGLVRNLFGRCIDLGRRYKQTRDKRDLYEALRLLGTGCHCLEDYSAHSNYCELALIEMGERQVFPHVGRDTAIRLQGANHPVYPIITGTFGGVDFLHSVLGELGDKATQSEIDELEGTINSSKNQDTSLLKELLDKLPPGLLGDEDQAGKADQLQANAQAAQMQNMHISPKEPEAFTQQVNELAQQIYPIMEFHDNLMMKINEAIDKIPVLPELIEQLQEQVSIFVFSLLAPFVLPIVNQVKIELNEGSSEIIQSSKEKQLIVFRDDNCSDPTHSMLSKDHFSNVLNEPCGKIASQVLKWVVPQIVDCWDDENTPIDRTLNRVIAGVFHHPAQRQYGQDGAADGRMLMFQTVERWWSGLGERQKDELRGKLSRDGVEQFRNHKEGVQDSGHGCCKPLGLPNARTSSSSGAPGGRDNAIAGAMMGGLQSALGGVTGASSQSQGRRPSGLQSQVGSSIGDMVGGGALGSIVGGVAGGLLGGALGGSDDKKEKKRYSGQNYEQDGSYTTHETEFGRRQDDHGRDDRYAQADHRVTQHPSGGYTEQYSRYEQDGRRGETGYGFSQTTTAYPTEQGGFQQRSERTYESGGVYQSEMRTQYQDSQGRQHVNVQQHSGSRKKDSDDDSDDSNDGDDWEKKQKKERKRREKEEKKRRKEMEGRRRSGSRKRSGSRRRSGSREQHHRKRSGSRKRSSSRERHGGGGGGGGYAQGGYSRQDYPSEGQSYGQSYGQTQSYESSGYGGSSGGYGQQEQSYNNRGFDERSSYSGGGYRETSSYGGGGYQEQSSYESRDYGEERSSGGRGYGDSGYGRGNDEEEYGERRQYGGNGGYSGGGGYGGGGYGGGY